MNTIFDAAEALWPNPDGMPLEELRLAERQLRALSDAFSVLLRQREWPAAAKEKLHD